MYLICSLCLIFIDLPDCPTYTLLHVLHFNLYIPLGFLLVGLSDNCCWMVLVALNTMFRLECLNRLVMRLIIRLKWKLPIFCYYLELSRDIVGVFVSWLSILS